MVNFDRFQLPEAAKEELTYFAISPPQKASFHTLPAEGSFTHAYDIWNTAAEDLITLRTKKCNFPGGAKVDVAHLLSKRSH